MAIPLQPPSNIDAVAHEIAIALLDDIPEMDADAKFDTPSRRDACIALDRSGLYLGSGTHRVDHAAEFGDEPVAD